MAAMFSNLIYSFLDHSKDLAAHQVGDIALRLREAGGRMRGGHRDLMAAEMDWVSGQIEGISDYLREKKSEELIAGAVKFVQRRPEVVIGGLLVAGLITASVLKGRQRLRAIEE